MKKKSTCLGINWKENAGFFNVKNKQTNKTNTNKTPKSNEEEKHMHRN